MTELKDFMDFAEFGRVDVLAKLSRIFNEAFAQQLEQLKKDAGF